MSPQELQQPRSQTQIEEPDQTYDESHQSIKRRQRASLVCTYCKKRKIKCDRLRPHCSACVKFSRECVYQVSWFSESPIPATTSSSNGSSNSSTHTNTTTVSSFSSDASREMALEIQALKEKLVMLEKLQGTTGPENGQLQQKHQQQLQTSHLLPGQLPPQKFQQRNLPLLVPTQQSQTPPLPQYQQPAQAQQKPDLFRFKEYAMDKLDVCEGYNSLCLKASSHEDNRALNHFTIYKRDHYYAFFCFFFFFYLHITRKFMEDTFRDDWKSKHLDGKSKWLLLLSNDKDDEKLIQFANKISKERAISKSGNVLPLLTLSNSDSDSSRNNELLLAEILSVLPNENVLNRFVNLFFQHLWSIRPFVEEVSFRKEIARIVTYNNDKPVLHLSERSDMATIALLLIILRHSSVSLELMNNSDVEFKYLELLKSPISVKAINVAQLCLSFYKILKKTTLKMLQALVLLRYYYKDAPEDGDGLTLTQSQQLTGFIIEAALNMGLNRDPTNFGQFDDTPQLVDLRRRLWFAITRIEIFSVILNGAVYNLPEKYAVNVQYPLLDREDPLSVAHREEYEKSAGLEDIYLRISKLVNNLHEKVNVAELLTYVQEASDYIDLNYKLQDNDPYLKIHEKLSKVYASVAFSNTMTLSKLILQKNLEAQVYSMLTIHYETTKYADSAKYFQLVNKQLQVARESLDLSLSLLLGKFNSQVPDIHSIELNPNTIYALCRVVTLLLSLTLHLYHAQELLQVPSYAQSATLKPADLEPIIDIMLQQCDYTIYVLRETLGLKYWSALKGVCSFKFRTNIMKKHRFKFMSNILDFLDKDTVPNFNANDHAHDHDEASRTKIRDRLLCSEKGVAGIIKQWVRIDISNVPAPDDSPAVGNQPKDLIVNVNHTNHFVNFNKDQLNLILETLNKDFKHIPEFKEMMTLHALQSLNEVHQTDPITSTLNETLCRDKGKDLQSQSPPQLTSGGENWMDLSNFDFNFLDMFHNNDDMFNSIFNGCNMEV